MSCVININLYAYAPKKRDRRMPWDGTGELIATRTEECDEKRGLEIMEEMMLVALQERNCALRGSVKVDGKFRGGQDLFPVPGRRSRGERW